MEPCKSSSVITAVTKAKWKSNHYTSRNGRERIGVAVPGGFRLFSGGRAPVSILIDTLHPVAVTAKQLQVLQAAAATLGVWNYMVDFQILI